MADELARRYPNNPAATAAARVGNAAGQLADNRFLKDQRDRRFSGTLGGVEASAMPATEDVEFPSKEKWQQITARAKGMQPTAKERAILKALNSPVTLDFKGARFEDVIEELQRITGQTILVDRQALDEVNVTYETPVKLQVKAVSMRTALRKLLGDLGLAYVVRDQTIQVMSQQRAASLMTVRYYPVGDLVASMNPFLPPGFNQLQTGANVQQLIDLMMQSVDPASWNVNGGPGSIVFYAPAMALVVKQSAEIHFLMGGGYSR